MSRMSGKRTFDRKGNLGGVEPVQPSVPLYFFDTRDNDNFIEDDVGIELPDLEAVKAQAARSLASSTIPPGTPMSFFRAACNGIWP